MLLVNLYTSRVILQTLGVEDYGIYNVVAGFVSMFAFLNNSLSYCTQRFFNNAKGKYGQSAFQKYFTTSIFIHIALALLVIVLVETIGLWFLMNKLVISDGRLSAAVFLFHMTVISMAILIIQAPFSSAVMAFERMDFFAIVGIIEVILKLGIVLVLPQIMFDSLVSYGVLLVFVSIIVFALYGLYSFIRIPETRGHFTIDKSIISQMISFSGWSVLGSFALMIRNQGLNILLNMSFGPVINAARGLSFQVKAGLEAMTSNISTAARPQITESYAKGEISRSTTLMLSSSKICFALMYFLALPLSSEIEFVLRLWLGGAFPDYTISFTLLIIVISLIDSFNGMSTTIIYAGEKIKWYNILTSMIGLLVLPISYFALKLYNEPVIVYFCSIFVSLSILLISVYCQQLYVGISSDIYCRKVLLPSFLLVVSTFWIPIIVRLLMDDSFVRVIINFAISALSVIVVSYCLVLEKNERELFNSYLLKFIGRGNER